MPFELDFEEHAGNSIPPRLTKFGSKQSALALHVYLKSQASMGLTVRVQRSDLSAPLPVVRFDQLSLWRLNHFDKKQASQAACSCFIDRYCVVSLSRVCPQTCESLMHQLKHPCLRQWELCSGALDVHWSIALQSTTILLYAHKWTSRFIQECKS